MFLRGLCLAVLLSVVIQAPALAEGFRCPKNDRLVEAGASMKRVVKICGQPKEREDLTTTTCTEDGECSSFKVGERWLYDFGPYTLTIILSFAGTRLAKVEQGEYGH
jgi:hypothetical protein